MTPTVRATLLLSLLTLVLTGCQQAAGWAVVNRTDRPVTAVELRSQKSGYEAFVVQASKVDPANYIAGPSAGELLAERTTLKWTDASGPHEQQVASPLLTLPTSFDGYAIFELTPSGWRFSTVDRAKAQDYLNTTPRP